MANKKVNKFANTNTVKTTENKSAETVVPAAAPVLPSQEQESV